MTLISTNSPINMTLIGRTGPKTRIRTMLRTVPTPHPIQLTRTARAARIRKT